ncbi:MAG: alpha/beta hydrolase [Pedosphaera sp.]|nr:alpha/beta hydrolase [Pedosphaera sp.]
MKKQTIAAKTLAFVVASVLLFLSANSHAGDSSTPSRSFSVEKHGHGSPVILIPGLACSGAVWEQTVAALQAKHECHVLTLAGFAGQPAISASLLKAVPEDLAKYIDSEKLVKPAIIGHSMGGFIALSTAAKYPGKIGSIIVVDSLPFFGGLQPGATIAQAKESAETMRGMMDHQSKDEFLAQSKQTLAYMVTGEEGQKKAFDWMSKSDQHTVANSFADLFATDLRPELPKIRTRALIIEAGAEVGAVPEETYKQQYKGLEGVKLVRVKGAKHFIMFDQPDVFLSNVKSFLDPEK